jgi:hypothetical protein
VVGEGYEGHGEARSGATVGGIGRELTDRSATLRRQAVRNRASSATSQP